MIFIIPVWHILRLFLLIPSGHYPHDSSQRKSHPIWRYLRLTFLVFLVLFLTFVFAQDLLLWVFNKSLWLKLFSGNNRILMLLVHIRSTAVLGKNWAIIMLFVLRSRSLRGYIDGNFKNLLNLFPVSRRRQQIHQILCAAIFVVPILISMVRLGFAAFIVYTKGDPNDRIPFYFRFINKWVLYTASYIAEIVGSLLAWSIVVFLASLGRILKECSEQFNKKLVTLRDEIRIVHKNGLSRSEYKEFIRKVADIRDNYEQLVDVFNEHEGLLSAQTFVAVVGYFMMTFSSLAGFFRPGGLSTLGFIIAALGCMMYFYQMAVICVYPIRLHEESEKSVEILQQIIYFHQRSSGHSGRVPQLSEATTTVEDLHMQIKDFQELYSFLQRILTKPLSLTVVGFADLNRSFLVTIAATVIGFTLFLLEQAEGQEYRSAGCQSFNSSV
ncbi:uncharacterized protein LOC129601817 [Paramacrobiotus metropolitanus]|uniref:uncharacterized protein LOC129601817 n=1 Tax=Paramacrobiotus metropolitanus TaxID=2943436 RepID=UPI002445DE9F|nr:uncharacterized protein LOC129601817 [Paramacrobiotus metropolitanus]